MKLFFDCIATSKRLIGMIEYPVLLLHIANEVIRVGCIGYGSHLLRVAIIVGTGSRIEETHQNRWIGRYKDRLATSSNGRAICVAFSVSLGQE
jgi:hypothetical protein